MRYLTLGEVIALHRLILEQSGGAYGVRDMRLLDSALAQPKTTFGGLDLHETVIDKAAALCASLVQNRPFLDGNKRIGHAAMATFLLLNGLEIDASIDEQERVMLAIASSGCDRSQLASWLRQHTKPVGSGPAA